MVAGNQSDRVRAEPSLPGQLQFARRYKFRCGVFGLAGGFFAGNIFPAAFEVVSQQRRASAVGWLNFFGSMLSGFAPLVGGLGKNVIGIEGLLSLTAVVYLAAAALLAVGINTWYQHDYQRVH